MDNLEKKLENSSANVDIDGGDLNHKKDEIQSEDVVKEENNVAADEQSENSSDGVDEKKAEDINEEKTVVEFSEDQTEAKTKKENKRKPFFVLKICLLIIAILIVIASIFGVWNRWIRFDDKTDIVGTWQFSSGFKTLVITNNQINIDENAVMDYTIDEGAKTINYTIGDMSGSTHYRFSADRSQLALVENCATDPISTMLSDLGWAWDYMTCKMAKIDLSPAYTKNNKEDVDIDNTGIKDIMFKGNTMSILLDKVSTKEVEESN